MAVYTSPSGSVTGMYAPARRRAGAAAIDWTICLVLYLLASIPGGMVQLAGPQVLVALSQAIAVAPVVAYFACYLTTGATLGMRALGLEVVVESTGNPAGWPRALARGLAALVAGAALLALFYVVFAFDEPPGGYGGEDRAAIVVAAIVGGVTALGKLWLLVDARRRTLQDVAFGLAVVDDLVETAPEPSPWDGLWRRS